MKPQILIEDWKGWHNTRDGELKKLDEELAYRDLSTIIVIATRGMIPSKIVQAWFNLILPMNQQVTRLFVVNAEVGKAYTEAVEAILTDPQLNERKWKYMLTLEEDNSPPADGLVKLYKSIDKYSVVGGLYWGKGEEGKPMIYGDPNIHPRTFQPQVPKIDTVQECCGLGMGFTLFDLDIFRDERLQKPYFKTVSEWRDGGYALATQDLYFFENAAKLGYRFACDTSVKVGHYDAKNDIFW